MSRKVKNNRKIKLLLFLVISLFITFFSCVNVKAYYRKNVNTSVFFATTEYTPLTFLLDKTIYASGNNNTTVELTINNSNNYNVTYTLSFSNTNATYLIDGASSTTYTVNGSESNIHVINITGATGDSIVVSINSVSPYSETSTKTINFDASNPTPVISGGDSAKQTSQTFNLSCTDNIGVVGYYFGTTEPSSSTTFTSVTSTTNWTGTTGSANSAATYWLGCKDAVGNIGKTSVVVRSINVSNMLLNADGIEANYNTNSYTRSTNPTYYVKTGTSFSAANMCSTPTNGNTLKGYNEAAPSTTTATLKSTDLTIDSNKTISCWYNRTSYQVTYDYQENYSYMADEYLDTGYKIDWSRNFTIEATFKIPTSGKRYLIIGNYNDSGNTLSIEISTANKIRVYMASGGVDRSSNGTIPLNTNISIVFTWNAATKAYSLTTSGTGVSDANISGTYSSMSTGVATNNLLTNRDHRGTGTFTALSISALKIKDTRLYNSTLSDLPTVSKVGHTVGGWYTTASSGGTQVTTSTTVPSSNVTYYSRRTINQYYFDLNGTLDGTNTGNISGYGTCDVYINGTKVGEDVADYYTQHPYGSTYTVNDCKASKGHTYNGVQSGYSLTGTIGASSKSVYVNFTTDVYKITLNNQSATSAGTTEVWYQYNKTKTVNNVTCYYYTNSSLTTCLSGGYTITNPTKTGYAFKGYYTSTNGGGTQYVAANGNFTNNIYTKVPSEINSSYTTAITLYAKWADEAAPAPTISGGTTAKQTSQTFNLSCTDSVGVTGYYWGTTEPSSSTTFTNITSTTNMTGKTGSANSAATYWLGCKDSAGNIGKTSVVVRSINVSNMLLNLNGTEANYNTSHYTRGSNPTYYVKSGTSFSAANMCSAPTGGNSLKGYNEAAPSTTTATLKSTDLAISANKTISCWYNRSTYTVTVSKPTNGSIKAETVTQTGNSVTASSSAQTLTVRYGDTVKATATASTGWHFNGWSGGYLTANTTTPQTGAAVTANKTITGAFTGNTYTLSFSNAPATGATVTTSAVQCIVTSGSSCNVTLPSTGYSYSGWTFNGWGTATNSTSGTAAGQSISLSGNATRYATWVKAAKTYTVSFSNAAATGATVNASAVSCTIAAVYNGASQATTCNVALPTSGYSYSGWTFNGWGTATSSTSGNTGTISISSTHTRYATWYKPAITRTASYNGNGNTGGSTTATSCTIAAVYNGASQGTSCNVTLASNGFTKTYADFMKWAIDSASGTQYSAGATVSLSSNKTFYAVWAIKVYIYFSTNGGTENSSTYSTVNGWISENGTDYFYQTVVGGANTDLYNYGTGRFEITRSGYNVPAGSEWCSKADGTGTCFDQDANYTYDQYKAASTYVTTGAAPYYELDLYVHWVQNIKWRYRVTCSCHGAGSQTNSTYKYSGFNYNTSDEAYWACSNGGGGISLCRSWCSDIGGTGAGYSQCFGMSNA